MQSEAVSNTPSSASDQSESDNDGLPTITAESETVLKTSFVQSGAVSTTPSSAPGETDQCLSNESGLPPLERILGNRNDETSAMKELSDLKRRLGVAEQYIEFLMKENKALQKNTDWNTADIVNLKVSNYIRSLSNMELVIT